MTESQFTGILCILIGLYGSAGAYFDWNWFMKSSSARIFVTTMGRNGARIFYGLLGTAFLGFGIFQLFV